MLGERPRVLARQIAHQPGDVLAGLLPRLDPGEAAAQPSVQLAQVLLRQHGLYHGRSGRLMIFLPHNRMIIGWPPSLHPPAGQGHEVRLPYQVSIARACALTGRSRATHYRRADPAGVVLGPLHGPHRPRRLPPCTLTDDERAAVLALLNSPTYRDLAIPQVWARELDEGRFLC